MNNVEDATATILEALNPGPLTGQELLEACGFDSDLVSLEKESTGTSSWDQSIYFAALTRLRKSDVVRWRHRDDLSTEYDLATRLPASLAAENSKIVTELRAFFEEICRGIDVPGTFVRFNVLSFPSKATSLPVTVFYDGEKVELLLYNFETDVGHVKPVDSWKWKPPSVNGIIESIKQLCDPSVPHD